MTASRGYRSADYPNGIDVDDAQYMSSLIPQERGFLWPISDVINGNEEKGRKPVKDFIREVNKYPGLLDIIQSIEGIINKRSSHASGVILYGDDPYETASFMRTPSGDLITCYDLHMAEASGDTKYDYLVTEISDKIIQCYELLKQDNLIPDISLRDWYNKYIHPEVLDTTDKQIWTHLAEGDIMDVFQFSTGVGLAIAKRLKPQNPQEMTVANAIMRLMSEKDKESQQDRYVRIKTQGIGAFEREMRLAEMPDEMRKIMHKYCDPYYGCCAIQEQAMELLMDVAGFTLGESNSARKIIAKKQMSKIPELKEKVFASFSNTKSAEYFWENIVAPQLGYAFSYNHSLPYSFVGMQTIYLATHYNPIYWDTACIIVNSGSLEDASEEELVDIYEPEGQDLSEGTTFEDLPDKSAKIKKTASTNYAKVAKAIGDARKIGINVSLANINQSLFGFRPDAKNNRILYGLKGMLNIGDDFIKEIISNRPYSSPKDFYYRVNPKKQAMISLIKGGAFDEMTERRFLMGWYIWETCDKKSRLTLQNLPSIIKYNLLPEETEEQIMARRVYEFNRYLKAISKGKVQKDCYLLDERATNFLVELGAENLIKEQGMIISAKDWDKIYQKHMDIFRDWLTKNKDKVLNELNFKIFQEDWIKYAGERGKDNYSAWEMETLCFYYHDHEMKNANFAKYGCADFFRLPEEPKVERTFPAKDGKEIRIYELKRICGTCIAKNKNKGIVSVLTPTGVVDVRFRKEYFSLFDRRISAIGADGKKHIIEKSFFDRGSMVLITGMRRGDEFVAKKYSHTGSHQLYKITEILPNGEFVLQHERAKGELEEDEE